jgi:coproporphyrinogen III oxidase
MTSKEKIAEAYGIIQDEICAGLELADGGALFKEELWEREGGGGGRTRIIQNGSIIEKGGVNFSAVYGKLPENVKQALGVSEDDFFATGVSIVIHPNHPWVPIIHMNIRYFEMTGESGKNMKWFGGGIDLTPHYVIDEDAQFFHAKLKETCERFQEGFYGKFKKWADDYFFIKHRNETRGVGGIFYDRLSPDSTNLEWGDIFEFSKAVGRTFLPVYTELIHRNRNKSVTEENKIWQYQRRSRYVEFNLVYDAGTKFGLETNGRIESILMSMPPQANWIYDFIPEPGSQEERTIKLLKKDINWLSR